MMLELKPITNSPLGIGIILAPEKLSTLLSFW